MRTGERHTAKLTATPKANKARWPRDGQTRMSDRCSATDATIPKITLRETSARNHSSQNEEAVCLTSEAHLHRQYCEKAGFHRQPIPRKQHGQRVPISTSIANQPISTFTAQRCWFAS